MRRKGRGRGKHTRIIYTVQPVSRQWIFQSAELSDSLLLQFENVHFVVCCQ